MIFPQKVYLPLKPLLVYSTSRKVDHVWVAYSKGGRIIICLYLMIEKGQIARKDHIVAKTLTPPTPSLQKILHVQQVNSFVLYLLPLWGGVCYAGTGIVNGTVSSFVVS